jgi:hypothetical protein
MRQFEVRKMRTSVTFRTIFAKYRNLIINHLVNSDQRKKALKFAFCELQIRLQAPARHLTPPAAAHHHSRAGESADTPATPQ